MYSSTESQVVVIEDDNDTVVNSVPHEPKTPTSPDLHPIVILDMPSPFAMTPRRPTSPSALAQLAMRNSLKAQDAAQIHPSEHPSSEPSAIQKLEEQVGRLAQEIDAFSVQRGDMLEVIAREQQVSTSSALFSSLSHAAIRLRRIRTNVVQIESLIQKISRILP